MKITDPTADLLTRIRNAARARKQMLTLPHSKHKMAICAVLKQHNYIQDVKKIKAGDFEDIMIELFENREDIHLKSISKPGQRIYLKANEIPRVLEGMGLAIISTPKGVMSGDAARKAKLGGEYICEVY